MSSSASIKQNSPKKPLFTRFFGYCRIFGEPVAPPDHTICHFLFSHFGDVGYSWLLRSIGCRSSS